MGELLSWFGGPYRSTLGASLVSMRQA